MNLEQLKAALKRALERLKEIRNTAIEKITDEIRTERDNLLTQAEKLADDIEKEERAIGLESRDSGSTVPPDGADSDPEKRTRIDVADTPVYRGSAAHALGSQLRDIMTVSDRSASDSMARQARSRLDQVTKRTRAIIEKNAAKEGRAAGDGMNQSVGSEGAFLLQGETSIELMTTGFNNSEVLKRTSNRTLTDSDFVNIVGIDEKSRATGSRGGGVRVYTTAELETMNESKPKLGGIRIEPKKLTGLFYASDELLRNAVFLGQEIRQLFGEEFAFKCQDLVLNGSGKGEALGVTKAPCLVVVPKETGQAAATIVTDNVLKMDSRVINDASPGLLWIVNRECKPQLATLVITAGDANALLYKTFQNQGVRAAELNGTQCVTVEQCSALGTVGDIMLCDFSQYITANKGDISEATSIHAKFEYNQTAFKFIYYFDGQPRWSSAITPYKGSATVSPFVSLGTRS